MIKINNTSLIYLRLLFLGGLSFFYSINVSANVGQVVFEKSSVITTEGDTVIINVRRESVDGSALEGIAQVDVIVEATPESANSADYVLTGSTLTWGAAEGGTKSVTLQIVKDKIKENQERLALVLVNPVNVTIASLFTSVTIIDDNSESEEDERLVAENAPTQIIQKNILTNCQNPEGNTEIFQKDCDILVTATTGSNEALEEIIPGAATSLLPTSFTQVFIHRSNIQQRLVALREDTDTSIFKGLSFRIQDKVLRAEDIAMLVDDLQGARGGAAGDDSEDTFRRLNFFLNGSIATGDHEQSDRETGYDLDIKGLTLGGDYRLKNNLIIGAALGYTNTKTDYNTNAGDNRVKAYQFLLYGSYYLSDKYYIDTSLGYGNDSFSQNRNINYILNSDLPSEYRVNQTFNSDTDGKQFNLSVNGGYTFTHKALSYGPALGLYYVKSDIDAYTETPKDANANGAGWAYHIVAESDTLLSLNLGGQVAYSMSQSWGILQPYLWFEWINDIDAPNREVSGYFEASGSNVTFLFEGDEVDDSYFNVRLGSSFVWKNGLSGFISYRKQLAYDNESLDEFTGGIRWEF